MKRFFLTLTLLLSFSAQGQTLAVGSVQLPHRYAEAGSWLRSPKSFEVQGPKQDLSKATALHISVAAGVAEGHTATVTKLRVYCDNGKTQDFDIVDMKKRVRLGSCKIRRASDIEVSGYSEYVSYFDVGFAAALGAAGLLAWKSGLLSSSQLVIPALYGTPLLGLGIGLARQQIDKKFFVPVQVTASEE